MTDGTQTLPAPQTKEEYQACLNYLQNVAPTTPRTAQAINAFQGLIDAMDDGGLEMPGPDLSK